MASWDTHRKQRPICNVLYPYSLPKRLGVLVNRAILENITRPT